MADEIQSEMLKAQDKGGVLWLICLFSVAWRFGTMHLNWPTEMIVPIFTKWYQRVCYSYT